MSVDLRPRSEMSDDPDLDVPRTLETPTRPKPFTGRDASILLGSALSAFAAVYLVFYRLVPLTGTVGFTICWYLLFLVIYRVVVSELEDARYARDRMMAVIVATGGVLVMIPLVLVIGYVAWKGWKGLSGAFFTKDLNLAGPNDPYDFGGAWHAIVGTLEQVALAVAISVPLGLMCAIFLNEVRGPLSRPVRVFVDAMSGVPTIICGLFIYSVWEVALGHGFSGWAAAMAISISMLPVITRTAEEVLRLVPDGLREASLALGTGEWRTTRGVVLPTARAGLVTAVILGLARAVGETAPLIMTSFNSAVMNANPFSGAQSSLPIYIFRNYQFGLPVPLQRAWTAALTLIALVLVLFTIARFVAGERHGFRTGRVLVAAGAAEAID
jgi:phosphate transport system permease protein